MLYKLKENLPTIEILLGYFFYIFLIIEFSFSIGIIWLIFMIYLWLFTAMILEQYTFKCLVNLVCSSGIIIAITYFFISGVEEVPFPEGALMFHIEGIAKSLILFFLSSVPMLLLNKHTIGENLTTFKKTKNKQTKKEEYDQNLWEEATIDDVKSGNYETI